MGKERQYYVAGAAVLAYLASAWLFRSRVFQLTRGCARATLALPAPSLISVARRGWAGAGGRGEVARKSTPT
ncbi:hypothetical protein CALCODRAFT_99596 [Calocera cornea HHB12733]|uniref:Uncharacterized protein n=1 Tax=Calocera cornea HHB12733 TaxID=1353952 RepID=A0A165D7E0_9BASI|nr:hypothetical protein CALCODRAFT_99596 [Calocera cornea HHB12733]